MANSDEQQTMNMLFLEFVSFKTDLKDSFRDMKDGFRDLKIEVVSLKETNKDLKQVITDFFEQDDDDEDSNNNKLGNIDKYIDRGMALAESNPALADKFMDLFGDKIGKLIDKLGGKND